MQYVDLTLPMPAENLACDEALLDLCEAGEAGELLRFWEPLDLFVVVGYGNAVDREVDRAACRARGVPILRRCSGGGTVLQGPGSLNYALVLRTDGPLNSIHRANQFILERHRAAIATLTGLPVQHEGQTDLTVGGRKFSGNSQRRRKTFLLFHGTFLLQMDLSPMRALLPLPSRQPAYRRHRAHEEFLMNLGVAAEALKDTLRQAWKALAPFDSPPRERIAALVRDRYGTAAWNDKF